MNLYVGNLPYRLTEDELRQPFEEIGVVASCTIITDRATGQSKGFAFIEMPDDAEAKNAIEQLNGYELKGRKIMVNQARPKDEGGGGGRRPRDRG